MAEVEKRFDENLAPFASRCEKRKGQSVNVLPRLAVEARQFDLVYVDGDHRAASVHNDAALSWPLLTAGGIMIFDDYQWDKKRPPAERPQMGIDSFLGTMMGQYRELHRGYQIIIEKF
jgi:predicted O-methyltransferase YrrM